MMRRVLIIGDVHGKIGEYFDLLKFFIRRYSRDENLYSLQLGDFGFGDAYQQRVNHFDRTHRYEISNHPFFGGNHDDYDRYYDSEVGALGDFGKVPFIPNSFFVRGAYSIDEDQRIVGRDWWAEEELGWKQSKEAIARYIETEPEIMFSHDGPESITDEMFPSKTSITTNTGMMLQTMFENHQPDKWLFGHWHQTKTYEKNGTTFRCLGELQSEEINI